MPRRPTPEDAAREARMLDGMLDEIEKVLGTRIDSLAKWLAKAAPFCERDHAHLIGGSNERAYWRYGYLAALRDVQDLIIRKRCLLD